MATVNETKNDVVIIELDRPRVIRYGHKALKMLSKLTGKDVDQIDMENFDMDDLEKYIYCGLLSDARENGETLKLEDMEDLLDQAPSVKYYMEKMQEALNISFGGFGGSEGNQEKPEMDPAKA